MWHASERENRHEKEIWLAEVNCRLKKERNALRDEPAKRDVAENRRIIKERAKIRASPKNPRRFSQASPIIIDEVPQTPVRLQTNVRSGAGTIVRSSRKETPERKVKNTNSPKAIAKDDQRRNKAVEGVKGKEGAMFFKTPRGDVSHWLGGMGQGGRLLLMAGGHRGGLEGNCISIYGTME